jgi:hypothetical protein
VRRGTAGVRGSLRLDVNARLDVCVWLCDGERLRARLLCVLRRGLCRGTLTEEAINDLRDVVAVHAARSER